MLKTGMSQSLFFVSRFECKRMCICTKLSKAWRGGGLETVANGLRAHTIEFDDKRQRRLWRDRSGEPLYISMEQDPAF